MRRYGLPGAALLLLLGAVLLRPRAAAVLVPEPRTDADFLAFDLDARPVSRGMAPARATAVMRAAERRRAAAEAPAVRRESRATVPRISDPVSFTRRSDIAEALQLVEAERDPMQREILILELLDAVAATDIAGVLQDLRELGVTSAVSLDVQARLVRRWALQDVEDAAAWVSGMPGGAARQAGMDQVAIAWVGQDAGAALAWARQLPAGQEREQAVRQVAYEVSRTQPAEALQLALALPADRARDELLRHAALQWAAQDPAAAAAWATALDDSTLREAVMASIAASWAEQDPLGAAEMVTQAMSPGRAQDDALIAIVQRCTQQNPLRAAEWVSQFPETALKETAMDNLVAIWSHQDAASLDAWLCSLGP
ncbi:MAG: hypothetical protein K8T26_01065 [Lentisphaerae bacterium]|nr:hypothetical protein [Lentisphaerota bacterium]